MLFNFCFTYVSVTTAPEQAMTNSSLIGLNSSVNQLTVIFCVAEYIDNNKYNKIR